MHSDIEFKDKIKLLGIILFYGIGSFGLALGGIVAIMGLVL